MQKHKLQKTGFCRQADKSKSVVSYQGVTGPSTYCQENALIVDTVNFPYT